MTMKIATRLRNVREIGVRSAVAHYFYLDGDGQPVTGDLSVPKLSKDGKSECAAVGEYVGMSPNSVLVPSVTEYEDTYRITDMRTAMEYLVREGLAELTSTDSVTVSRAELQAAFTREKSAE